MTVVVAFAITTLFFKVIISDYFVREKSGSVTVGIAVN